MMRPKNYAFHNTIKLAFNKVSSAEKIIENIQSIYKDSANRLILVVSLLPIGTECILAVG